MVKYKKRPASARPALVRVRDVGDAVRDYEVALKRAGIKPAAYEEVFSLMVRFRDFAPNQAHFRKYAAGSSRFIARRFLKMFGERVWGTDRKYIRSGLPNGGLRYALANPDRNVGKLVDILASAFHEMRGRMFTRAEEAATENEETTSFNAEDDDKEGEKEEDWKTDAETSATEDDEDDENEAETGEADAGSSQRRRSEMKKSRLSRTVEYSEGEVTDEEQDSSNRLRSLEAHRASTREVDDEMPYDFDRPVQGITAEQEQTIDEFMSQLDGMKTTAPAMYHHFCLQVLRHYRQGRPI